MYCSYCGTQYVSEPRFCPGCGKNPKLKGSLRTFCHLCGEKIYIPNKVCTCRIYFWLAKCHRHISYFTFNNLFTNNDLKKQSRSSELLVRFAFFISGFCGCLFLVLVIYMTNSGEGFHWPW